MRSPNTFTDTSDSDSTDEERGRPAQEVHSTVMHSAEYVSVPMPPERPPIVRIPNLDKTVTLLDRNVGLGFEKPADQPSKAETDDEDEDDEQDEQAQRSTRPAPSPSATPAPQQTQAEYQWPTEEQLAQVEANAEAGQAGTDHPEAQTVPRTEQVPVAQVVSHETTAGQPMYEAEYTSPGHEQPVAPLAGDQSPSFPAPHGQTVEYVTPPSPRTETYQWPAASVDTTQPIPVPSRPAPRPPVPPTPGNTGGQPPMPPDNRPPSAEFSGYPEPNAPQPGYSEAAPQHSYDRPVTVSHNYNVQPQPAYYRGVDTLARLGVVGNFIGNRRTRKKLGKKIDQNRQESNANFADIQAEQQRFEQQQRTQSRELYNLRQQSPVRTEAAPQAPVPYAERRGQAFLTAAEMPHIPPADSLPPIGRTSGARTERPIAPTERLAVPSEAPTQEQTEQLQPLELRPNEHVKRSSWHNIVVDERGHEVAGAIRYGEEFRRERQKEIMRDRSTDAAAVSLGGMAVGSQAPYGGGGQASPYAGGLPSGMTNPTLASGAPAHVDPQHQLPPKAPRDRTVPGPVFWVMLVVIVTAFLAAALI